MGVQMQDHLIPAVSRGEPSLRRDGEHSGGGAVPDFGIVTISKFFPRVCHLYA